jgi:hypothetical protein
VSPKLYPIARDYLSGLRLSDNYKKWREFDMKKVISMIMCFVMVFATGSIVSAQDPAPYIKANDLQNTVNIYSTERDLLPVEIGLDVGDKLNVDADWWIVALTALGWYFYDIPCLCWRDTLSPVYQGPLADIPEIEIPNAPDVPGDNPVFYFAVDLVMDGVINEPIFFTGVVVNIFNVAGQYNGSFSGDDFGTWSIDIDNSGVVTGNGISAEDGGFTIQGTVEGKGVLQFTAGTTSIGGEFTGTIGFDGQVSGNWVNDFWNDSGSFTGTKVSGLN